MTMKETKTRGLVIKCSDYGESDRIVTFISRDLGKIRGIAKGARRSLKRFGGCLEQFALVDMIIRPRDGLSLLMEGKVVRNYKKIKADIDKIFYGSYLLDLTSSLVGEGHDDNIEDIFHLLLSGLETLEECEFDEGCVRAYEVRILNKVGYMPSFLCCISCGNDVEPYRSRLSTVDMNIGFSSLKGGVFCELCEKGTDDRLEFISFGTLKTLEAATHKKVSFTRHALEESGKIIPPFISHRLGKRLKSLDFLERVKGL